MKKSLSLMLILSVVLCLFSGCGSKLTIPDIFNTDAIAAAAAISDLGLTPDVVEENSYVIEEGMVIRTEPEIGDWAKAGQKVTIYVSKGISPAADPEGYFYYVMKNRLNVSGLTEDEDDDFEWEYIEGYCIRDVDNDGMSELILKRNYQNLDIDVRIIKVDAENDCLIFLKEINAEDGNFYYYENIKAYIGYVFKTNYYGVSFEDNIYYSINLPDEEYPYYRAEKDIKHAGSGNSIEDISFNTEDEYNSFIGNIQTIEFSPLPESTSNRNE